MAASTFGAKFLGLDLRTWMKGANPNDLMTTNAKDGCEIKTMTKGFKYEMVVGTLLQSKFPM